MLDPAGEAGCHISHDMLNGGEALPRLANGSW
jgi:hypothetical protein